MKHCKITFGPQHCHSVDERADDVAMVTESLIYGFHHHHMELDEGFYSVLLILLYFIESLPAG